MESSRKLAAHVAEIKKRLKRTSRDAVEIGKRLTACKQIVRHGEWRAWLEREFGWKESTALRFMQAYQLVQSKNVKMTDLTSMPPSVLYAISAPGTPQTARDELVARVKQGEKLAVHEARELIVRHRPARQLSKKLLLVHEPEQSPTILTLDVAGATEVGRWLTASSSAISRWDFSDDDLPIVIEKLADIERKALRVVATFIDRLAAARRLN